MSDPDRVLIAGDWHGNTDWAVGVIEKLPALLPDESRRIVLHAGDFGIWPEAAEYVDDVAIALNEANALLYFVDGNHEDFTQLNDALSRASGRRDVPIGGWEGWGVPQRISWLPRGHRWTWHGRTWLALGGATSVDRAARVVGRSWWPGERLSPVDLYTACAPGPADVMFTHDCPAGVPLDLPRPAPAWWELKAAAAHRQTLRECVDEVRPSHLIHGHYHLSHESLVSMAHGDVQVAGLDCDGATSGNFRVLDVRTMAWETT